jgi:hypothetical protein
METIKSENKNQKEEINEEEPSLIKYIINKDEMFKLIGNNSNKKFSRDYQQINKRGGRIKNFFLKCFRNNCRKDDLIMTVVVIISIICYHFGLTKCEKDPSECTIKRGMIFYFTIGILSAISAVLYAVFITLSIYKRKYFIHYLYSIPAYIYYMASDNGTSTLHHGFYNAFGWCVISLIVFPILLFILIMNNLYKRKKYKSIFVIIVVIIIISILYDNYPGFTCDYWDLGLNNTRIYNDETKYPCEILHPGKNKCYLKLFDGFFDMSRFLRPSCSADNIIDKEKDVLINSLSKDFFGISKLNHFGYPITTVPDKYSMYNVKDLQDYQDLLTHSIIKMDVYNEKNYPNEPYPEVELFFDENGHGNIKINVTKNETLSKERKKIAENKHSLYNNVLLVYVDALSRNIFQRKMHKISKYIEPYMLYNLDEKEKEYTTFQFMKYNTLKGLTIPNIKAMFYGIGLEESNGVNLVKYFKEQGFVTGHTGTTCGKEIFSVNALLQSQKLDYDSWDHENIALFCDQNFFDPEYPLTKGVASVLKRCLYGKYAFEYMIDYTEQFWKMYPDNKKFFRIHFNEGHEGTMELVTYLADPLFEFIKYFFDNKLLDDTFMFILSDHGNHMVGPWALIRPKDYLIESTLATLFFVMPNNKKLYKDGLYDIIHENQQTFITPYDIHDTLIHLAYGTDEPAPNAYSKHGNSLLVELNKMERYCESPKLNLEISKSDCKCKLYKHKK